MNDSNFTQESKETIDFNELISALLNNDEVFSPRYLFRFSDLNLKEFDLFKNTWPKVSEIRRKSLLEDLEDLSESNTLMIFENIFEFAMKDENSVIRQTAIRALWEHDDKSLIPKLIDRLENDPEEIVRCQAATGLGNFVYLGELGKLQQSNLDVIVNKLFELINSDADRRIQMRALESLGFSGDDRIPELIENKYDFGDEEWITSAIIAMGRSNDDQWHPHIMDTLDHGNNQIRLEAAKAAGSLAIHNSDISLIELTNDEDDEIRMAAVWSLSEIGGDDVKHTFEILIENTVDEEELDLIQNAIDNLAYNEEMGNFSLLNISSDDTEEPNIPTPPPEE